MTDLPIPWENIFQVGWELTKNTIGKPLTSVWQHHQWKRAAKVYRERIFEWYGTTRILGKSDPVVLDRIFTDVLIWEKPQHVRYISAEALQDAFLMGDSPEGMQRLDGLVALEQHHHLFILGKPGAGKTTFLKWIALRCADEFLKGIPIFVSLKEMADAGRTVWDSILFAFSACQFPNPESFIKSLLMSGQMVILFDGLDEVSGEQGAQDKVIDDLRDFVRIFPKNRIVITCRVAAISYTFDDFKYVEMAEFTAEQIETYINRYFDPDAILARACLVEISKPKHKGLLDIAGSPLLLSLLCLNYEETFTFPVRRVDLYEDALKALLVKWDGSRRIRRDASAIYKRLPSGQKLHLYAWLAYENFSKGHYFIPSKIIEAQTEAYLRTVSIFDDQFIDANLVLRTMETQHGIIVERAKDVHAFAHLTFQEYYTAKYIVDNQISGTIDVLFRHCNDLRWREVFLLSASLLSQADLFFETFLLHLEQYANTTSRFVELLIASTKRVSYYKMLTPIEVRWWSIYLVLACNHTATNFQEIALAHTRDFAYSLDLNVTRTGNRTSELALARARDLTRSRNIALSLVQALERDLSLIESREIRFDILSLALCNTVWVSQSLAILINFAIHTATELGLTSLAVALSALDLPQSDDTQGNDPIWDSFRKRVAALVLEYRGLRLDYQFTKEVVDSIKDYFQMASLLLECLSISTVSDRKGIKERLLLPPSRLL